MKGALNMFWKTRKRKTENADNSRFERVDAITAFTVKSAIVVILYSKHKERGIYNQSELTFGEVEDLANESLTNDGIMYFIERRCNNG